MTTCNRSSACSCLHSRGYFSQIRGPAVSICSVVPPGIQLFLHPSPGHIGFFVLILVNHVHKWPPRIQASQGNMHIQIHPYPSLGIWQGSPTHLSASSATTPKSMFHPTATMILITIKSVYIFPLLKHSYVTSRLSRKWKFLPSAARFLEPSHCPPCTSSSVIHLLSFIICSTTLLSYCPSEIPCLVSLQALALAVYFAWNVLLLLVIHISSQRPNIKWNLPWTSKIN